MKKNRCELCGKSGNTLVGIGNKWYCVEPCFGKALESKINPLTESLKKVFG